MLPSFCAATQTAAAALGALPAAAQAPARPARIEGPFANNARRLVLRGRFEANPVQASAAPR